MNRKTQLHCACAVLAIATFASPVLAQDEQSGDDRRTNNTIVVTAQFREQMLQDTPLAITAVTSEIMEAKNQTDLSQLAESAPSVSLRPQGASFGPSVSAYIRGIGQNDFNPAYEPGVGIYIDDVYYPSLTGASFDLLDLERVEILRGPQGTLAGRNSVGGAIKLYSSRPNGSTGGFVEATYGSRNKIGFRGSVQFPIAQDLSGRISGVYKSQNGYVDVLDFGCANPPGSPLNDGTSSQLPSGTFPIIQPTAAAASSDCKIGEMGDTNYGAVRGVLRYQPSEIDLDIMLAADYTRDSRSNSAEVLLKTAPIESPNMSIPLDDRFVCGAFCNYESIYLPGGNWVKTFGPWASDGTPLSEMRGENKTEYEGYNLTANINLGVTDNVTIDAITGYGAYTTAFDTSNELSPAVRGGSLNDLDHWHWSQEVRVSIQPVDPVVLVLGAYYFEQQTDYDASVFGRTFGGYPTDFYQDDTVEADSKAAFANLSWEVAPDLNFNGGIRYTEESKVYNYGRYDLLTGDIAQFIDPVGWACGYGFDGVDTQDCNNNGNTTEVLRALTGNPASYEEDRIDWRAAVDYRFSPELLVYGSVSTGFKGGGTNPRPFNAYQAVPFGPEELISYEIGIKSDLFDDRLRLNVAGFIADYDGLQVSVSQCPLLPSAPAGTPTSPCGARVNGGDARYQGIEVEAFAEPIDDFTIDASLSLLDFDWKDLYPQLDANGDPVLDGNGNEVPAASNTSLDDPPTGAPKVKWNIGAQYRIDMGGLGSITPRVDVDHTGDIFQGYRYNGVRTTIDAYTLLHASLTWRNEDEDLSISLRARNLTDKYYYYAIFDQLSTSRYSKGAVAPPREISLVVKKDF